MEIVGPDEIKEGKEEFSSQEEAKQHQFYHNQEDSFVWDENSQLYYHPRSGFYHDPNAGWYYSTRDGFYYKFEDGNYVLLDSHEGNQPVSQGQDQCALDESRLQTTFEQEDGQNNQENVCEPDQIGCIEYISNEVLENHPPPSEWLEDTLIELYLSGYSNAAAKAADGMIFPMETDEKDISMLSADGKDELQEMEEAELNLDNQEATDSNASTYEDASWEEESWRAQYGQVVQHDEGLVPRFSVVDMWDWSMAKEVQKEGNRQVARLVGKLVQPSSKLHPSMPSGGGRLRSAPICKVHLDLVQVRSGQVYKLRSPNARYLATLSSYDASNPTKDWGFPELSVERIEESCQSRTSLQALSEQRKKLPNQPSDLQCKTHQYRNRAAERRALHGGFGIAPGQKKSADDSPVSVSVEEAAAEALELSFGASSYAQKILKNMGWKEGDPLGKTHQGLKEPLECIGNKGTAGLGWASERTK